MQKLSESQRASLREATDLYRESLPGSPAEEYLASRGIPAVTRFGLGYVADARPGHEMYKGCLAIPYMRWSEWRGWSVASIRFRRLDGGNPKYMTVAGDKPRLYNTVALTRYSRDMSIAEGEIDAVTAELAGVPCVGVPGARCGNRISGNCSWGIGTSTFSLTGTSPVWSSLSRWRRRCLTHGSSLCHPARMSTR